MDRVMVGFRNVSRPIVGELRLENRRGGIIGRRIERLTELGSISVEGVRLQTELPRKPIGVLDALIPAFDGRLMVLLMAPERKG